MYKIHTFGLPVKTRRHKGMGISYSEVWTLKRTWASIKPGLLEMNKIVTNRWAKKENGGPLSGAGIPPMTNSEFPKTAKRGKKPTFMVNLFPPQLAPCVTTFQFLCGHHLFHSVKHPERSN